MIRRAVFPLLLALLALAACNGGGEEAQPTPTPTAEVQAPTPQPTATPQPEPAVQRIAYRGTDGSLWIMNADGSGQQKLFDIETEPGDSVAGIRWSPDGSKFAVTTCESPIPPDFGPCTDRIIYIVSADGETLVEVPGVRFLRWSPDGTRIAFRTCEPVTPPDFGPCNDRIYVMNADGSNLTLLAEDIPASDLHWWSPDGSRIAISSDGIYVINADGSGLTRLDIAASYVDWSPDGRWLALFAGIRELGHSSEVSGMLADLQTMEVEPIDPDEQPINENATSPPIFSPTDASLLAYGSRLFDLNTGQERSLPGVAVSWSPNGQQLLLGCGPAQVYDVEGARSVLEFDISLPGVGVPCWALMRRESAWSPDSRFLATHDSVLAPDTLGVLHIRDIAVGDDKTVSPDFSHSLQFSPDSRLLLFLGTDGIWVVGSDGSNITLLAEGTEAAWRPQP